METTVETKDVKRMVCMEVWGGNQFTDQLVKTTGLDVRIYSKPYADSDDGGDVYYVSSCASGRITRLLLSDVSGHGDSAAPAADRLRALMRHNINYVNQGKFVHSLNSQFCASADEGRFATALVCTYFYPTKTLKVTSAGHPPPLLYRVKERRWTSLTRGTKEAGQNLPFGIDDDTNYQDFSTKLAPGDAVLCYSDALIETRKPNGEMLRPSGLLDVVNSIAPDFDRDFPKSLLQALAQVNNGNLNSDDTTILFFRPNNEGVSLKNNLLAPFRLVGGWLGRY